MRYFTKAKTMPDQQAQGCPVANNIRSGMASKWTATGRATWSDTQVRMDLAGRDSCVICGLTYWFEAKQPGVHGLLKDRLRNYEIYEIWTKENITKKLENQKQISEARDLQPMASLNRLIATLREPARLGEVSTRRSSDTTLLLGHCQSLSRWEGTDAWFWPMGS